MTELTAAAHCGHILKTRKVNDTTPHCTRTPGHEGSHIWRNLAGHSARWDAVESDDPHGKAVYQVWTVDATGADRGMYDRYADVEHNWDGPEARLDLAKAMGGEQFWNEATDGPLWWPMDLLYGLERPETDYCGQPGLGPTEGQTVTCGRPVGHDGTHASGMRNVASFVWVGSSRAWRQWTP